MIADLAGVVRGFGRLRALVIGEAMLDSYLRGDAHRLSVEAPVPIVSVRQRTDSPGGAANAAVNAAGLGATVTLLSVIGDDDEGARLRRALERARVDPDHLVITPGRRTLAKERLLAGDHMLARIDQGTTDPVDVTSEDRLIERLQSAWAEVDVVIVSDYGYGVVTPRVLAALHEAQQASARPLIVDARDLRLYRHLGVTAVKPNYAEAVGLLGEAVRRGATARAAHVGASGERLLELTGARLVAVTMDADGVFVFERDAPTYRTSCRPRTDAQAAGGGDTFVATLALALASGSDTAEAAELASVAGSVVVGRPGTSVCSVDDLIAALSIGDKRIDDLGELRRRADRYRAQGRRIVFTNGCFDLLHRGHVTYLQRAKALGDLLIVAVNSDASVRRLKGPGRPLNPLDDRLLVLEALSSVDHVVAFDEDTPDRLLEAVRPAVFVKGGDYSRATLPEADLVEGLGGTVQILPLVDDRSTTGIITRAHASVRDGDGHGDGLGRGAVAPSTEQAERPPRRGEQATEPAGAR